MIWDFTNVNLQTSGVHRLKDLSLQIPSGRTAIVGYSGAGKSSLLSLLAGMEKPTSGQIRFAAAQASDVGCPLFWAPQNDGLWPHLTVEAHLTAVRANRSENREFADKFLDQFDLSSRRQAFPEELSAGEKSRLAVARAIAANPGVLLMDEPLSHVDPARRSRYWKIIDEHLQRTKADFVFTTHDPATALLFSDRTLCLKSGQCLFLGATMQLYQRPDSQELAEFLGPTNWLEEADRRVWIPAESCASVRPERLQVVSDVQGDCEVLSFRFAGGYAETTIRREKHVRTFLHRPDCLALKVGDRVTVKTIS